MSSLSRARSPTESKNMRIVHEVKGPTSSSAFNCQAYPVEPENPSGLPRGFHVEVLMVVDNYNSDEEIEIEGDARRIREALQDAIDALDIIACDLVEDGKLDPEWAKSDEDGEDDNTNAAKS